jgi:hypothetical protein
MVWYVPEPELATELVVAVAFMEVVARNTVELALSGQHCDRKS